MTASSGDQPELARGGRRRLLAMLGAGGATVVASQLHQGTASAGHDGTNALHLGAANTVPTDAATSVAADVDDHALAVENLSTGTTSGGLKGVGHATGVEGISHEGVGVIGRHTSTGEGFDRTDGVYGETVRGAGVRGHSISGAGVGGSCDDGPGVIGFGTSDFGTSHERAPGVLGLGFSDHGVSGFTERPDRAGVFGAAESCLERGGEPGDPCSEPSLGTGVLGEGQAGTGVRGHSDSGVGVEAHSASGLALRVDGRAGFSSVGSGSVAAGQTSAFVADAAIGSDDHVVVVLTTNPGSRQLHWVQVTAGSGFTVHMTSAPPKQRPATSFTYHIVEPA